MSRGILWAVPKREIDVAARYPCLPDRPHITLFYGCSEDFAIPWVGKEFWAGYNEAWDSRIQVLPINLPATILCESGRPHLTVSWIEGVQPVEAIAMLEGPHSTYAINGVEKFQIEFLRWAE